MIRTVIAIFIGGGAGSLLRYGLQVFLHRHIAQYDFPWATFTVNIIGCFLIGLFYSISAHLNLSDEIKFMLTAGLCGGLTTFSTFSHDNMELLYQGQWGMFLVYTITSIIFGIAAAIAGGYVINHIK